MSGSKAGAARARKGKGQGGVDTRPAPAAHAPAARGPAATAAEPSSAAAAEPREGEYVVQLPTFEGPLDLLLHLIQQHELDILDIPVSFVTEKYLEYLKLMQSLTIDLASEYLVMAATLAHIKSKMLLPSVPAGQDDDGMPGEDEEDPRAELVRRLLEYQKYKVAAGELAERGTLGRDVFTRGMSEDEVPKGPAPFASTSIFSLLDAFERVLKRANIQVDHEVVFDRISITDRIVELTEKLSVRRAMRFDDLLLDSVSKGGVIPRFEVVITFLAVLEMCKMKLIRVHQTDPLAQIYIELAGAAGAPGLTAEEVAAEAESVPVATAEEVAGEAEPVEAVAEAMAEEVAAEAEPVEAVAEAAMAEEVAAEAEPVEAVAEAMVEEVAAGAEPVEAVPEAMAEEDVPVAAPEEDTLGAAADRDGERDVSEPPSGAEGCIGATPDDGSNGGEGGASGDPETNVGGSASGGELSRDEAADTIAAAPPDGVAMTPAAVDTVDAGSNSDGG